MQSATGGSGAAESVLDELVEQEEEVWKQSSRKRSRYTLAAERRELPRLQDLLSYRGIDSSFHYLSCNCGLPPLHSVVLSNGNELLCAGLKASVEKDTELAQQLEEEGAWERLIRQTTAWYRINADGSAELWISPSSYIALAKWASKGFPSSWLSSGDPYSEIMLVQNGLSVPLQTVRVALAIKTGWKKKGARIPPPGSTLRAEPGVVSPDGKPVLVRADEERVEKKQAPDAKSKTAAKKKAKRASGKRRRQGKRHRASERDDSDLSSTTTASSDEDGEEDEVVSLPAKVTSEDSEGKKGPAFNAKEFLDELWSSLNKPSKKKPERKPVTARAARPTKKAPERPIRTEQEQALLSSGLFRNLEAGTTAASAEAVALFNAGDDISEIPDASQVQPASLQTALPKKRPVARSLVDDEGSSEIEWEDEDEEMAPVLPRAAPVPPKPSAPAPVPPTPIRRPSAAPVVPTSPSARAAAISVRRAFSASSAAKAPLPAPASVAPPATEGIGRGRGRGRDSSSSGSSSKSVSTSKSKFRLPPKMQQQPKQVPQRRKKAALLDRTAPGGSSATAITVIDDDDGKAAAEEDEVVVLSSKTPPASYRNRLLHWKPAAAKVTSKTPPSSARPFPSALPFTRRPAAVARGPSQTLLDLERRLFSGAIGGGTDNSAGAEQAAEPSNKSEGKGDREEAASSASVDSSSSEAAAVPEPVEEKAVTVLVSGDSTRVTAPDQSAFSKAEESSERQYR